MSKMRKRKRKKRKKRKKKIRKKGGRRELNLKLLLIDFGWKLVGILFDCNRDPRR